jgi:hypothetical protein
MFHKKGVDRVEISGLDKKENLNAIDAELSKKGMIKSDNPDLLVNIFTKERERIDVNQYNAGWGYGWGTDGTLTYGRSQLQLNNRRNAILT